MFAKPAPGWGSRRATPRQSVANSRQDGGSHINGKSPPPPPPPPPQQQRQQQQPAAPWALSSYYTKKQERRTDQLGNIISGPDTIAPAPGWTPDAQLRLAAEALAPQLQADAAALLEQVERLKALLPGMETALRRLKPAELVRKASQLEEIARQLVALRARFPAADVAAMVAAHPPLLRMGAEELDAAIAAVQAAFPEASQEQVEAMLATSPGLLASDNLDACLRGGGHLMSRQQLARCLASDPTFLYQFQGLEGQSRGERDADYLADMFRPSL